MKLQINNRRKMENSHTHEIKQHIPDQPIGQRRNKKEHTKYIETNKMETQHNKVKV